MANRIVKLRDFSVHPGGRYRNHGPASGEEFREKIVEALRSGEAVTVDLDGVAIITPSFLEEVFGGLAREMDSLGFDGPTLSRKVRVVSSEQRVCVVEALSFLNAAIKSKP